MDQTPLTNRRALSPDEIDALLAKCEPVRRIVYEGAMVSCLRRNELLSIRVVDLDAARGGLVLNKIALARHSTPDITFRRYVKSVDSELVRIAEAVGQVVAGPVAT